MPAWKFRTRDAEYLDRISTSSLIRFSLVNLPVVVLDWQLFLELLRHTAVRSSWRVKLDVGVSSEFYYQSLGK